MVRKSLMFGIALLGLMFASWGSAQAPAFTNVFDQIQNIKDIEAVRMVVLREIEGCLKGDAEQVFSCYDADNVVFFHALGNPDPKTWVIWEVGRDDIREYADGFKGRPDPSIKNPGETHSAEIQHVHVKGNNALAVARHNDVTPDKEKGKTTTDDWETVFLLKKNAKGEWKITGWLGAASWKREVTDL